MNVTRTTVIAAVAIGAIGAIVINAKSILPKATYYKISDAIGRLTAPNFKEPPDLFTARKQDDILGEYRRRGYQLNCYADLRPEERIGKGEDYQCWALIKTAYDNIPANLVTFSFSKGKLMHVRLEFPEKSYAKLQDYLQRRMDGIPRLDRLPSYRFGTDIYGKPLMVWGAREGVVVTSAQPTPGMANVLLWSHLDWQGPHSRLSAIN